MSTFVYASTRGGDRPSPRISTVETPRGLAPVISLFSGAGGMDLGFAAAGFDLRLSTDIDHHSCETLCINHRRRPFLREHPVLRQDIRELRSDTIMAAAGVARGETGLIIGGPPCQAFSVFGRRGGLADPRGNLVWEFLRIVRELDPQAFVFENVGGLRSIHGGKLYGDLIQALSCNGRYLVSDHAYDMADYGVPQFRYRIIIIGVRGGRQIPPMQPTHSADDGSLPAWKTAGQALADMPAPGSACSPPNHIGRVHSQRIIDRYEGLAFGERDPKTRINRLHPQRPSFTIIVGSDAGGGKGHVHPYFPREVTPRESARLQTFPDWWEFAGTGRHVIRQVGNAVPPLFSAQLAGYLRHHLYGQEPLDWREAVSLLDIGFLR